MNIVLRQDNFFINKSWWGSPLRVTFVVNILVGSFEEKIIHWVKTALAVGK